MATQTKPIGYLPQDRPPFAAMVALGFQHVITMFPATVLVALLTGFDVGVTLFASGLATVVALLGSGMRIPLYYGSSFSYIAAVAAIVGAEAGGVRVAQGGIIATGVVSILAGLIIRAVGKEALDKVLPPIITGSVAIVIGISLAKTALDMASAGWGIAVFTLVTTILFSVYLRGKGLISMLPVLLGAASKCLLSVALGAVTFGRGRGQVDQRARLYDSYLQVAGNPGHRAHRHRHYPRVDGPPLPDRSVRRPPGRRPGPATAAHPAPHRPEPDPRRRWRRHQRAPRWLRWDELWREQLAHGHHAQLLVPGVGGGGRHHILLSFIGKLGAIVRRCPPP